VKDIILASASPRRKLLLKQCGLKFKVAASSADEKTKLKRPSAVVKELALRKASDVAEKIQKGIVIGADTIVVVDGRIIGKPRSANHAEKILRAINGGYHKVYTGVAVLDASSGRRSVFYEMSRVKMRKLCKDELKRLGGKHMDKAGAYAIQEKEDAFVDYIKGDYYNVVGLPVKKLARMLRGFKIKLRIDRIN
jgi:septum formation protein